MSVRKTVVRLAAAALVVAGGAVTVWAQPNMVQSLDNATIPIKIEYPYTGKIEALPSVLGDDADAVARFDVGTYKDINPGNVGYLKISTNAPSWDVTFFTENGGVPFGPGEEDTRQQDPLCVPNPFLGTTCDMETYMKPGASLLYNTKKALIGTGDDSHSRLADPSISTTKDVVLLDMAIGLAGAFPTAGAGVYAQGAEGGVIINPTRITKDKMITSKKPTTGSGTPVSFAERLCEDAENGTTGTQNSNLGGLESLWGPKTGPAGTTGTVIANPTTFWVTGGLDTKGFPPPPKTGAAYFYVNIGIHPNNTSDIAELAGKTYTETFTFNLMGGF